MTNGDHPEGYSEDETERTLRAAFAARAEGAVHDARPVPPPRFRAEPAPARRRSRWLAPVAAAAAVVALAGGVLAVANEAGSGGGAARPLAGGRSTGPIPSHPVTPAPTRAARAVHVKLFNADGATYGVGMPVIAYFNRKITDARPFAGATRVTVNGAPIEAAWYFQPSAAGLGKLEAHLRPRTYWPAHAQVHVDLPTKGLTAGSGMVYDDSLTLDFRTGPRVVATVNDKNHRLTVSSDGSTLGSYPVSLGGPKTPTTRGVKVIMEKDPSVCMTDVKGTYKECGVKYAQRLTYSGEFLHAAPWNVANIKSGVDTSNGCTNLLPIDAAHLYDTLNVGDVVAFPDASGPAMTLAGGFGDWDVPWSTWVQGGLLKTS